MQESCTSGFVDLSPDSISWMHVMHVAVGKKKDLYASKALMQVANTARSLFRLCCGL